MSGQQGPGPFAHLSAADMEAARRRRDRDRRNPWNRLVHLVHKYRHRELHRRYCTCRGR